MKAFFTELVLRPLSYVYGGVVALRNKLYDLEVLHSRKPRIRTLSVGNITVGGTGKTPHSEYIIELLKDNFNVAYLSRGYKRKTKGFVMATADTPWQYIGDEAFQIKTKYPDIITAVDANRFRAVDKIAELYPDTDVVLLDDAYQHRSISPDLSILLVDYNRLITEDHLLPWGRLRESAGNTDRADMIVITKCPVNLSDADILSVRTAISPFPYQYMFFTAIRYKKPQSCFSLQNETLMDYDILAVTGIASPVPFYNHLKSFANSVRTISFPDHHAFTNKDMATIGKEFELINSDKRAIVVTEKDFVRLAKMPMPDSIKENLWYVGIEIEFLRNESATFDSKILSFISSNQI